MTDNIFKRLEALHTRVTLELKAKNEEAAKKLFFEAHMGRVKLIKRNQQSRNGVIPSVSTFSGDRGTVATRENVKLTGALISDFDYRKEIVKVAIGMLAQLAPRGKSIYDGRTKKASSNPYYKSFRIYLNGIEINRLPDTLASGDEILIFSPLPYSRRLEVGKIESARKREDGSLDSDNYFVIDQSKAYLIKNTADKLAILYGNVAKIKNVFTTIRGTGLRTRHLSTQYTAGRSGQRVRRRRQQHIGEQIRQPAIKISKRAL